MEDPESVVEPDVAALSFSRLFFDGNSIPRVGVFGVGRPPVLFPVAFRLVGLLCCSFRVSLTASLEASSLNMFCRGVFGFSISKKRKQGSTLRRIYMQRNR